jgi:hypothetical protein
MMSVSATADIEELKKLVYHPSSAVILKVLENKNLTDDLVLIIANRRNVEPKILETIYNDLRWRENYKILYSLCKNPKTPQKISVSILRLLRVIDLADITRNKQIPINVRMKAELYISEKIMTLPLGIKIAIARRASSNVLIKLIEDGVKEVVSICLDSPYLEEGEICKIISSKKTTPHVIRQIAIHPKWSCRYNIQWQLILNNYTPLSIVVNFLKNIRTSDLKELYYLSGLPLSTRPFIYRELLDRGEEILSTKGD